MFTVELAAMWRAVHTPLWHGGYTEGCGLRIDVGLSVRDTVLRVHYLPVLRRLVALCTVCEAATKEMASGSRGRSTEQLRVGDALTG